MDILMMTRNRCPAEGLFGEVPSFMIGTKNANDGKLPGHDAFEADYASYVDRLNAKKPRTAVLPA